MVIALLAFAGAQSAVPGAGSNGAAAPTCGSLAIQEGAPVGGSELRDIAYVSDDESWAVGDMLDRTTHQNRTLIERFDGSAWSVVPSPNQSTPSNTLNGVSMTSGGGWAVGDAIATAGWTYQPMAMHWNGTQWTLASPASLPHDSYFTGVDALTDTSAWAVGFQATADGTRHTLIEHATGTTWTPVASPNDGTPTTYNTLTAIGGTSATGLWAVGYQLSPAGPKPLVLRYDTTRPSPSWVSVSGAGGVPSPGAVETILTGVDVRTASDVWAVGYYDNGTVKRPLALHWNGSTWSNSPVPGAGLLREVKAVGPGNVWAAGTDSPAGGGIKTLVVHFDGTAWTTSVTAGTHAGEELIGVSTNATGSALTVVGRRAAGTLIEQARCPTGPVSLASKAASPVPPAPVAPGVGPAPGPPPKTPPATVPIPVTITDRATAAGLGGPPNLTWSAAIADFNGDGWTDLFIPQHYHAAHLWISNSDGTFSEPDPGAFGGGDRHDCLAADFNADGRPDIFCSIGADRGTALKSSQFYIQQAGHTFSQDAYQWNVTDLVGRGRHSAILDANNDGYPDLFSGTESLRADGLPTLNRLYLNTGHGSMLDSPAMGLDLITGSRCAHDVDYNSDGWPDLLVCEDHGLHLYKNNNGHGFQDVSSILGGSVAAQDAVMADINHDSRADLIVVTGTTVTKSLQRADGTFAPPSTIVTVKGGTALATGDVNGDHNPDIYVVGGKAGGANAPDYLLIGDASGTFTSQPIPQTTIGAGDRVYALDYNRDGLTDFLVLNGGDPYNGPIQLLSPTPKTAAGQPR